jgi:hypothetical protein
MCPRFSGVGLLDDHHLATLNRATPTSQAKPGPALPPADTSSRTRLARPVHLDQAILDPGQARPRMSRRLSGPLFSGAGQPLRQMAAEPQPATLDDCALMLMIFQLPGALP